MAAADAGRRGALGRRAGHRRGARALRRAGYDGPLFLDAGAVAEETLEGDNAAAVEGAYAVHPMSLAGSTLTNTTTAALDRRDFVIRYIQALRRVHRLRPVRLGRPPADRERRPGWPAASTGAGCGRSWRTRSPRGMAGSYSLRARLRHGGMDGESLGIYTVSQGTWTRVS